MDFGFIRSSTDDYKRPNKETDRVVLSYDGHSAYLLIIDSASRYVWCFLTKSKEPPVAILRAFMSKYGTGSGVIRTDQSGKLARSTAFRNTMLQDFGYVIEPTGTDSPSQNGGAEIYNNTLAVKVCTLLYGSGLPARFWSAALLRAVYLHNRLVHSMTHKTPFDGWHGRKPNVTQLKTFGPRVCVKRTGLIGTTLRASSLAIRPPIKTFSISTLSPVSSSLVTMQSSMKRGISSQLIPPQPNSYTCSPRRKSLSLNIE